MSRPRIRAIQVALVAFIAILILLIIPLIGSIDSIEFRPGRDYDSAASPAFAGPPPISPGWELVTWIMRVVMVFSVVLLGIQLLTNRESRRIYVFIALLAFIALLLADFAGCDRQPIEEPVMRQPEELWERPEEADLDLQPVVREVEASNSQYIILAIVLSTLVVIAGGAILLKWGKAHPQATDDGLDEILDSISDAAHRIRAGEDPYTVVLFCYQEMIRILSAAGRIDATCLTPREFEIRLRGVGLSDASIPQLTGIFEIVRYAGRADDTFATRALACLDAIQEAQVIDDEP